MKATIQLNTVPEISSIQDMVLRSSRVYGQKTALEDLKDTPIPRLTFASLLSTVLKFGIALRRLGVPERSHIAI